MKKISLLALACVSAMNLAYAAYDHSNSIYLPLNFGLYSPDSERGYDNGVVGTAGLGYNFTNYFAAQANVFAFGLDQTNGNNMTPGYYANLEGRLNLANRTILTPYAVLGAGALKIDSANVGWDYGAGLNLALSPSMALDTSWRQIRQVGGGTPSASPHDNVYLFGMVWTFGQTPAMKPTPAPVPVPVPVAAPAPVVNKQQAMLNKAQTTLKSILPAGVVLCKGNHVGNQAGCVTFEGNQMIMHLNVKFMKAKYAIQNQYGTPIQSLGNFMNAYPNTNVTLYGYASSEGILSFNKKLSANRATAVKKYLVNQSNITPSRIATKGMGIQDPIASNATADGRALNRRVEAMIAVPAELVQVDNNS